MVLKNKLLNLQIVPFFILSFPVFVDLLNGFMQGADSEGDSMVGLLYRGGVLLFSLPFLKHYKYNRLLYSIIAVGGIVLSFHIILGGFTRNDFTQFVKIIYGFFLLSILLGHRNFKDKEVVCDCAIFYGLFAALSLIICKVLGVGYASYIEGTFGLRGFFIATNDVGLTMLMMNALALYRFLDTGQWRYFVFSITISAGCALVGSMACYMGTVMLYVAYILASIIAKRRAPQKNKSDRVRIGFTVVVILLLGAYAVTTIINIIMEDSYLSSKYEDVGATLAENGGRASLINAGEQFIGARPFLENIVGSGDKFLLGVSTIGGYGSQQAKGVESDFWDLYGCYGIILVILIYWLPVKALFRSLRLLLKRREQVYYWTLVLTLIFLGHAFYGGHAFTSPLSASYYVITIYLLDEDMQARRREVKHSVTENKLNKQ